MITEITIENFKSFGSPQTIPLKPITLLYGPNSSGKSSIIQFLLMLKQTLESSNNEPLLTKGNLVELGDFNNIIHKHNNHNNLGIRFQLKLMTGETDLEKRSEINGKSNFSFKCTFKENHNKPEIKSIQYQIAGYDLPLICFNFSDEIKNLIVDRNAMWYAEPVEKKKNRAVWEKYSKPSKDDTFNIFNFVDENHPRLKQLYDIMANKINVIIIPIKKNIQRIFGSDYNLSKLKDLTNEQFRAYILKKSKIKLNSKTNNDFIEKLDEFYYKEVSILKEKYLQYSGFSYESFLKDFRECAGMIGYVNLHNFIFKKKIDQNFFDTIGLNPFVRDQLIKTPKESDLGREPSVFDKSIEKFAKAIDPMGFLSKQLDPLGFLFDGYDPYEEYGITISEELMKKLLILAKKLKKDSQLFSNGLELSSLTPKKIERWYKRWGHLGAGKYEELSISNEFDLRKYQFSEYYNSVSEYINYVHSIYLKFNLHELVDKVYREISDFLNKIEYIAPLRAMPERYYLKKTNIESGVMGKGEFVPEILKNSREIEKNLNTVFRQLGIEYQVCIKREGSAKNNEGAFSIDLYDKRLKTNVNLKDLGQGISQVIPIIMAGILSPKSYIIIEQPEIHIHPRLQAELGSFFAECIKNFLPNSFIIETHSEALILRLQKLIRKKELKPEDVAVIYVEKDGGESVCRELRLDENGDFIDAWPGGFFEEGFKEMFD